MEEPFFDSSNAAYAQVMFEQYARNPESVPEAWRRLFADGGHRPLAEGLFVPDQLNANRTGAEAPAPIAPAPIAPAPIAPTATPAAAPLPEAPPARLGPAEILPGLESAALSHSEAAEHLRRALPMISRAAALIQAFRDHGHQLARIDPLGSDPVGHPQLNPAFHGTTMEDLSLLPASLLLEDDQGDKAGDHRIPPAPAPGLAGKTYRPRQHRFACEKPPQFLGQKLRRGVALGRFFLQAFQADRLQVTRHGRIQQTHRHRIAL